MTALATRVQISQRSVEQVEMKVGDSIVVDAKFLDSSGNEAPIDGLTVWNSTNPAMLTVSGNGPEATVIALSPGLSEVVCYADADLSSGVRNIAGRLTVNVTQREAEVVELTVRS